MGINEERVKVVIITSMGLPPFLGGIENVVDTILNSSLKHKYEFLVFDTYRKPDPNRSLFEKVMYGFKLIFSCYKYLDMNKPELVHIHFCSNNDFWKHSICLVVSKIVGIKTIFHLHGGSFDKIYISYNEILKLLVRIVFKIPDRVIALSEYWRHFLSQFVSLEVLRVINNPIDCSKFSFPPANKQIDRAGYRIILLGSVGKRKGHFDVLKALPIILKENREVRFIFAGADETSGATELLQNIAKKEQLVDFIEFLGPVSGKDKIKLLQSCSFMILPSYGENMPISILEGMASQLPIIASNVGAIPELLENGNLGILIEAGDYESLAQAVVRLIKNPTLANTFAEKSLTKVTTLYDVNNIVKSLDNLYNETL